MKIHRLEKARLAITRGWRAIEHANSAVIHGLCAIIVE